MDQRFVKTYNNVRDVSPARLFGDAMPAQKQPKFLFY